MAQRRNWSEWEIRHALALYLRTDFGRLHKDNPDIIKLAAHLDRTPSALALKLCNLAALDTTLRRKGMAHTSKIDRRVWSEFLLDPSSVLEAYESQKKLFRKMKDKPVPKYGHTGMEESSADFLFDVSAHASGERKVETIQRIGQDFFREMILTSYRGCCALTGIEDSRLLIASHIVPWKEDADNRINPSNGICLNALHDRAFDRHLITFDEDYRMQIAPHVPLVARKKLERVENPRLEMPSRFLPDQGFLEAHRKIFFKKSKELDA